MVKEQRFAYPVFLDLSDRRAVVVGGGNVALRKAQSLADAGAAVVAVAPEFLPEFASDTRISCLRERYERRHLSGAAIVIAATDDEAVNARVAADARAAGVLVNVVDRPAMCDFIVPACVVRGPLVIAISTGGAAPSLARRLRQRLEAEFGPEYGPYLEAVGETRRRMVSENLDAGTRRRLFERLSEPDIIEAARGGPDALRAAIDAATAEILGQGR